MKGSIVPLVGRSCAGKTRLAEHLIAHHNFVRVVTTTTRPIREGERHGVDYHFLSKKDFERNVKDGLFAEHALVCGHYYGVAAADLKLSISKGVNVVMVVDPQGAATISEWGKSNSINVICALVTAGDYTLSAKLFERYCTDLERSADQNKTTAHYESRFINLMTTERCWEDVSEYHIRLQNAHTPASLDAMASEIITLAAAPLLPQISFNLGKIAAPNLPQIQALAADFKKQAQANIDANKFINESYSL